MEKPPTALELAKQALERESDAKLQVLVDNPEKSEITLSGGMTREEQQALAQEIIAARKAA